MLSLKITDIRKFTSLLFTTDAFDRFLFHDAQFLTAATTTIQGRKNEEFFSDEEKDEALKIPYVTYADMRPFCLQLIRGKRLPVSFRIVLLTDPAVTQALVKKAEFNSCQVSSLSMNITYKENELFLTAGVSYSGFTLEKSLEKLWELTVREFLDGRECSFTDM